MSFSTYLDNALLDEVFGAMDYASPTTLYVGLSTADPTKDGSGIAEPSTGAYARVSITNNKTTFTSSSSGQLKNAITITFPQATASWGTLSHFFLSDSSTGGNMIAYSSLTVSKSIASGDTASFEANSLQINLD